MSFQVQQVQLDASDTVVTVRDRLSGLRGRRVLLIWPESGSNLRRKLDLVLIQREAYRRAIQLAIVTQEPRLKFFAAELNISCFASVDLGLVERWKRGRHKVFLPRYHKPSASLPAEDMAFMRARRQRYSPWRTLIERVMVLALLFAAVAAALYTVLPGAVVTLSLQEEKVSLVLDILADRKVTSVDAAKGIIPARTIRETVEATASLPTSGSVRLDSVSANAIVTFTNLGETSIVIPRGTILGTSAGEPILFETVAAVLVPGGIGQSADGAVVAMESYRGSIGNVGPGMINTVLGGLAERVSVINLTSAAGGSNRRVRSVAVADQDKLLELLPIQLQSLAYEQMRAQLSNSQIIIIESIKIEDQRKEWIEFSADVGTMTSELSLTMRAVVSALVIDDRYSRQLLLARLKAAAPPEKQLRPDTVTYDRGPFSQSRTDGQISFTVSGSAVVIAKLDSDDLRERLAGLSLEEARNLLADQSAISTVEPPQIEVFPSGLERMPQLAVRIEAQVRDRASEQG